MTKEATSRIQSSEGKQHGGGVPKERFHSSRAQSTADKRDNQKNQSPGRQFGKEKTRALLCYNYNTAVDLAFCRRDLELRH